MKFVPRFLAFALLAAVIVGCSGSSTTPSTPEKKVDPGDKRTGKGGAVDPQDMLKGIDMDKMMKEAMDKMKDKLPKDGKFPDPKDLKGPDPKDLKGPDLKGPKVPDPKDPKIPDPKDPPGK
jgi:hypothetical protein